MNSGKYLYRLRTERNLTQRELGDIIGIRLERICEWERDKHQMKLSTFIDITKKLNIKNINYILRDFSE